MKKINIIYLVVVPVLLGIFYINWNYARHTVMFYGFAENKDTEINHDHPVLVNKIYVTQGQFVSKGELLLDVTHSRFDLKMNDLSHDIKAMKLKAQVRQTEILSTIRQLEARRTAKVTDIERKIQQLQSEIAFNQSLMKGLKSLEVADTTEGKSPNEVKMESLRQEMELATKSFDIEINQLEKELATVNGPLEVEVSKLESEKNFYEAEERKLSIRAPKDGLIGNIHCLEGENRSSFSTLITFYERNPTQVKGYVHENLIVHVNVGDTLEVSSSLHPAHRGYGTVVGLGSRIVEIPARLRKMPEIKTYGREVLIQIPPDNPFLQKEKVVLNFLHPKEVSPIRLFPFSESTGSSKSNNQEAAFQR